MADVRWVRRESVQVLGRLGRIRLVEARRSETLGGEELDLGSVVYSSTSSITPWLRDERSVNTSLPATPYTEPLTKLGVRRHGCCYVIVSWCAARVGPRRSLR